MGAVYVCGCSSNVEIIHVIAADDNVALSVVPYEEIERVVRSMKSWKAPGSIIF